MDHYIDLINFTAPIEDHGTTHFSVVDEQRNVVAITSTVCGVGRFTSVDQSWIRFEISVDIYGSFIE